MRILLVEDNRDILANMADYLQIKGYTVDCAQDGLAGLRLASSEHYDLLVLDIMLPGIDGYTLCRRLREDARRDTPVIMLTARDQLDDRLQGFQAGADDYLVKPFALSELAARIEAVLRRSLGGGKRLLQVGDLSYDLDTLEIVRAGQAAQAQPGGAQAARPADAEEPARGAARGRWRRRCGATTVRTVTACAAMCTSCARRSTNPSGQPLLHTVHGVGYRLAERVDGV